VSIIMLMKRGYYYVFFDIDGRYWTLRLIDRNNYITHEELVAYLVDCFPSPMCSDVIDGVVRVDAIDVDYYTIMNIRIKNLSIKVVSGGLMPMNGRYIFLHGLRYGDFVKKMSSEGSETFFRNMFYITLSQVSDLEKNCNETIESIIKNYTDSFKYVKQIALSTVEATKKTLGFLSKPESILAAEAALSMVAPPSPPSLPSPPSPPSPPVKKSLIQRIIEKIRRKKVVESE